MDAQNSQKTALGLDPKIESVACYALWFITGIVVLALEKKEFKSVRFHAWQSVFTFLPLFLISLITRPISKFSL